MKATIGKRFSFEAAHVIPWHKNPDGTPGKCSNLHGHSYHGIAYLKGEVDKLGWVKDFYKIGQDLNSLTFDHKFLNDLARFISLPDQNRIWHPETPVTSLDEQTYWPTTEHVAASILTALRYLDDRYIRVVVQETDQTEVIVDAQDLDDERTKPLPARK